MRYPILAMSLVLGLFVAIAESDAATIQSYARVNLVQGTDILVVPQELPDAGQILSPAGIYSETTTGPDFSSHFKFAIKGPANYTVNLHMASMDTRDEMTEHNIVAGSLTSSLHDSNGLIFVHFPTPQFGQTARHADYRPTDTADIFNGNSNTAGQNQRLFISVVYE